MSTRAEAVFDGMLYVMNSDGYPSRVIPLLVDCVLDSDSAAELESYLADSFDHTETVPIGMGFTGLADYEYEVELGDGEAKIKVLYGGEPEEEDIEEIKDILKKEGLLDKCQIGVEGNAIVLTVPIRKKSFVKLWLHDMWEEIGPSIVETSLTEEELQDMVDKIVAEFEEQGDFNWIYEDILEELEKRGAIKTIEIKDEYWIRA